MNRARASATQIKITRVEVRQTRPPAYRDRDSPAGVRVLGFPWRTFQCRGARLFQSRCARTSGVWGKQTIISSLRYSLKRVAKRQHEAAFKTASRRLRSRPGRSRRIRTPGRVT